MNILLILVVKPVAVVDGTRLATPETRARSRQGSNDWDELPSTPPADPRDCWSPRWEAAVAVTLAHLLVASNGKRVSVPDGPVAKAFRRAIDGLLPPGPPQRHLTLAGPGLPTDDTDIALVPRHPQTGQAWPCEAGTVVPLASDVWTYLAYHDEPFSS
ncbi:hypothetical protein MF672_006100 [Actinomadura sp. ATCC 31491]|uniref:Uncharacterized protein n=1 Tax=Actinomadura luzonensis TaxID=2805427 RepID=A0ABT0FM71_9ACTN|nr:hypothetical protein [Actinomadura luzonensis]MCK2213367.1 hypothetical protein [Actinomadura luzonensis]